MNKKIIRIVSWVLLFLMINQGYNVKVTYAYTIDTSQQIIDTARLTLEGKDLNSWINSLISDGKKNIYIKDGTYNLSDSIIIDQPGVSVYGESNTNTKLVQTNPNAKSIVITQSNIHVSNLYIDGSLGKEVFHAQNAENVHDVSIEDCVIYGSNMNSAIAFYGNDTNKGSDNSIERNEIHAQLSGSEKDGILFYNQKNAIISNNKVIGSRIGLRKCGNSIVTKNSINDSASGGIRATVPAQDNVISDNSIKNTKEAGIAVVQDDDFKSIYEHDKFRFDGMEITGNKIIGSQYFGIEVSNLKNAIISDNTVENIDFEGIYLLYSDYLTIKHNTIFNCGLYNISGGLWNEKFNSGIFLDTEVQYSNIQDNIIDNDSNCPYGVRIQSGANNINNIITDNIITGDFTEGISANEGFPENTYSQTAVPTKIVVTVTESSITLNWDAISGIKDYEVEIDGGTIVPGVNITNYIHNVLANPSTHEYRVRMKYGQWSKVVTATTLLPPPKNITTSVTNDSITVSWDGVVGTTGYDIEVDEHEIDNGIKTSYIQNGLQSDSPHKYRVRTKGGQWSNVVAATTLKSSIISVVPQNIITTAAVNDITVGWDEVVGATGYDIEVDENVVSNGISTSYVHTGLKGNTNHKYRVRIKGGKWSNEVTVTTLDSEIISAVPQNITTTAAVNAIAVGWDEVVGATGYEIEVDNGNVVDNKMNTSYVHTGLKSNFNYKYRVRIKGGDWSNFVEAKTLRSSNTSNNSSSSKGHKHKISNQNYNLEFSLINEKSLIYHKNLIKDNEEDKFREMLLYTFEDQYYLNIKAWRNNKNVMNTQFEINLNPENLFTASEIKNISINRNYQLDTILVRDYSDRLNTQEKTDLYKYSLVNEYIFSLENTGMHLQEKQKYIRSVDQSNSKDIQSKENNNTISITK